MNTIIDIYFNILMIGMVSLRAYEKPFYPLYVLDRAITVCKDNFQIIGHPL